MRSRPLHGHRNICSEMTVSFQCGARQHRKTNINRKLLQQHFPTLTWPLSTQSFHPEPKMNNLAKIQHQRLKLSGFQSHVGMLLIDTRKPKGNSIWENLE